MKQAIVPLTLIMLFSGLKEPHYEYVKDTNRYVALVRGERFSIGKLDASGNFDPDPRFHNLDIHGALSSCPPYKILNPRKERVYEYRSGRLIIGDLDEKGDFVPEVNSKIIEFKDYHYAEGVLRIYNLPGYYLKQGESKKSGESKGR